MKNTGTRGTLSAAALLAAAVALGILLNMAAIWSASAGGTRRAASTASADVADEPLACGGIMPWERQFYVD
jgi:hypothetical protein